MKDYSAMSDEDINKLVGGHIGFADKLMVGTGQKDYCNNPADAWPIIMDNKISIRNIYQACNCHDGWMANFLHVSSKIENSPLRAAMIVFLMMKDRESSHG
ncbi:phage protein NinX family protein [Yersinia mollaretii]|uniref:phage protein NinX family protein n=1 Tax=Yersinia mollaretii TaxID=33060 RepID=UPI00119EB339|nr:phage protein NinX family protein [Yersinia mollaretii]